MKRRIEALPPPPPRDAFGASQGARRAARPLSLITALPSSQGHLHEQTPLTTTSLSSPFVVNNSTIRAVSAGGSGPASRGVSPASNGMSGQYNVPYDPRHWASGTPDVYEPQSQAALEGQFANTCCTGTKANVSARWDTVSASTIHGPCGQRFERSF